MNIKTLLIQPLSVAAAVAAFSLPTQACTLFEEPRSFNTQTFRLEYPDAAEPTEAAEADLASDPTAADPYAATPLELEPQLIIFIGNQPNRDFQVVVTDSRKETLATLRTCVLDAFITQTRVGKYIQVGSFTHRSEAEAVSGRLAQAGYPARVIHLRQR